MQQFDGFHDSVHEDLCLDEPRVGVARHPVRDHAGERDDGLGHLPVAVDRCRRGIRIRLHTVCFNWDKIKILGTCIELLFFCWFTAVSNR